MNIKEARLLCTPHFAKIVKRGDGQRASNTLAVAMVHGRHVGQPHVAGVPESCVVRVTEQSAAVGGRLPADNVRNPMASNIVNGPNGLGTIKQHGLYVLCFFFPYLQSQPQYSQFSA